MCSLAAPVAAQKTASVSPEVTPTTPPAVVRSADVIPYRINAGDDIEIYVWGEERLQREIRVLPDGTIAMPLVGQLTAQGLLPEQLQDAVSKRLAGQYRGTPPQVTVSVRNPAGLQFSIIGKVRSPGSFAPGRYVNLLEALTIAGGPAEFANMDNVSIVRKTGGSVTTLHARLSGVLKNGVPNGRQGEEAIPRIQSGDTIIVP
ncbi:polysaccharide biosynthesis/export family protein [uncultured Sphingomonas sp.]|uniref:polysaccharide biosynthesis/export family protein n=1 Tax=uncultured Sphingomonas sp. TaxID=158754 RepID=UPI0035C9D942